MTHQIEDLNRREINFAKSKIKDVLPEYFVAEYPNVITFLEKYYQYQDSDARDAFNTDINNILTIRDISQTELTYLDNLISEIGNGLQVASFFQQPRLMTKLLAGFYSSKGTILSAEGFFRAFFNEQATIEYPKDQIFIVNDSLIGYESQKFLIDDELYQTFSILVKVGISVVDYEVLYKKFVHPAGFHFSGQVATQNEVTLDTQGIGINPLDSAEATILVSQASSPVTNLFTQTTALLESDGSQFRITVDETIDKFSDISLTVLDSAYGTIDRILSPNSFTTDDPGPDVSLDVETMDNTMFTRYTSDSAY